MRDFDVLEHNPGNRWRWNGAFLHGLLVVHAVTSVAVVCGGRAGFERLQSLPGSRVVAAVAVACALVGLGLGLFRRGCLLAVRLAMSGGSLLPTAWLVALVAGADYDRIAAFLSSATFGESGDGFWFAGVPLPALGYTLVLSSYTWVCVLCVSEVLPRWRRVLTAMVWTFCALSFAGVVHWATGW